MTIIELLLAAVDFDSDASGGFTIVPSAEPHEQVGP